MPRGDKSSYSSKQKRMARRIEEGYESRGVGGREASRRAWATVNKETGGGRKRSPGRKRRTSTRSTSTATRSGSRRTSSSASRGRKASTRRTSSRRTTRSTSRKK
jgi:hypothetical protein